MDKLSLPVGCADGVCCSLFTVPPPPLPPSTPTQSPSTMPSSKKRAREHSVSPKFHRVRWSEKKTRRGTILAPTLVPQSQSPKTPTKSKIRATAQGAKPSQGHRLPLSEGIEAAMSLPPIPAPEIFAPKKGRAER